jgi:tRNA(Arg) A34 adenosine deaminase TadA
MTAAGMTRFVCGCSWSEGGHCGDVDEVVVRAGSESEAVLLAEAKWRAEVLPSHPTISLAEVFVIKAGRRLVWRETPST